MKINLKNGVTITFKGELAEALQGLKGVEEFLEIPLDKIENKLKTTGIEKTGIEKTPRTTWVSPFYLKKK
jgi:hypothetical protein